ncbi:hypothetical protein CF319_g9442 [Tilletia indica]|nr:hypothetical protein CF319_g9442 [Tilletia indica]
MLTSSFHLEQAAQRSAGPLPHHHHQHQVAFVAEECTMSSSTVRLPLGAVVAPPQDPAAEGADDNNAALHAITSSPLPAVPLSPTVASPRAFSEQGAHKRKRGGSDGVEHTCAAHSLPGEHASASQSTPSHVVASDTISNSSPSARTTSSKAQTPSNKRAALLAAGTGSGKTMIWVLIALALTKANLLIISPLKSLQLEQVSSKMWIGLL